jgi:hypothetical protein
LSISEVMISLVFRNARRIPGIDAHAAPPPQPAITIAAITTGFGQPRPPK